MIFGDGARLAAAATMAGAMALLSGCAQPERIAGANWVGPATSAHGQEYTPPAGLSGDVTGWVVLRCQVGSAQNLRLCSVMHEAPAGQGFGAAAIRLKDGLRIREAGPGASIYQRVHFCQPEAPADCQQAKAASAVFAGQLADIDAMIRFHDCRGAAALARQTGEPAAELDVSIRCGGGADPARPARAGTAVHIP